MSNYKLVQLEPTPEPVAFCEDAALSLAERTFSTEVDEQLASDITQYARRLHTLYTATQPAEQKPVCPTCYGRGWDEEWDCQNDFSAVTCPDCAGSGKAENSITIAVANTAAREIIRLEKELHDIASEVVSCGCGHVTASLRDMAMKICAEQERREQQPVEKDRP